MFLNTDSRLLQQIPYYLKTSFKIGGLEKTTDLASEHKLLLVMLLLTPTVRFQSHLVLLTARQLWLMLSYLVTGHTLHKLCFKLILLISLFVLFISFASVQAQPKLETHQTLEKTSVITGEEIRGIVYIKNSGDKPLKIRGISSSCGCTTLRLKQRIVLPEKEVELHFFIDTKGKLGLIEKTITLHTNAADSPHIETMHFHALPSGMKGADTQAIFDPPCASCHLDSGVGKSEEALYKAICAMCHPARKFNLKNPQTLYTMIYDGNPHIGMPGYGEYLTEKQIESLIPFLSNK